MTIREFYALCNGHARYNGVSEDGADHPSKSPKKATLADIQGWA